jgi:hypothetical protein
VDWAVLEVVVGLSFLFFLLSILVSALNEAIAGIFKLRARTLERGIANILTGSTRPAGRTAEIVQEVYGHALVNGYGKDAEKPSYLSSRSFRNALLDVTDLLSATSDPSDDPLRAQELRLAIKETIDAVANDHLRDVLSAIWLSAHQDAVEFRAAIERWFDRNMERVSGWYKRRVQVLVFVLGLVLAVALNASALTTADRLWKESGLRKGLVAQAGNQSESVSGTEALDRLEQLQLPIGWEEDNRPHGLGEWTEAILGWILTALALTLGAPFWFDVLGRVSNVRSAGAKPETVLTPSPSKKEVSEVTLNIETDRNGPPGEA